MRSRRRFLNQAGSTRSWEELHHQHSAASFTVTSRPGTCFHELKARGVLEIRPSDSHCPISLEIVSKSGDRRGPRQPKRFHDEIHLITPYANAAGSRRGLEYSSLTATEDRIRQVHTAKHPARTTMARRPNGLLIHALLCLRDGHPIRSWTMRSIMSVIDQVLAG